MKKYIDISEHQGIVSFEALKSHVDGVIIRAGYGRGNIDKQAVRNFTECNRLGIPCGAYWFSYAYTAEMAKYEATCFLNAVAPYELELPLAFDYEYDSVSYGQKKGANVTPALVKSMTNAFCQTIEAAGYWCMLYANADYINRFFENLANRYDLWLAQWPSSTPNLASPPRNCGIWQWTSKGSFPGISGNVDTNEAYKDYAAYLREHGFNRLKPKDEDPPAVTEPTPEPEPEKPDLHAEAMAWAKENGLTVNDDPVTKADICEMFYLMDKKYSGLLEDD